MIAGSRAIRTTQGRLDEATHTRQAHGGALDIDFTNPRVLGVPERSTMVTSTSIPSADVTALAISLAIGRPRTTMYRSRAMVVGSIRRRR